MWIKVMYRMQGADDIKIYGGSEMLVEMNQSMRTFKN